MSHLQWRCLYRERLDLGCHFCMTLSHEKGTDVAGLALRFSCPVHGSEKRSSILERVLSFPQSGLKELNASHLRMLSVRVSWFAHHCLTEGGKESLSKHLFQKLASHSHSCAGGEVGDSPSSAEGVLLFRGPMFWVNFKLATITKEGCREHLSVVPGCRFLLFSGWAICCSCV